MQWLAEKKPGCLGNLTCKIAIFKEMGTFLKSCHALVQFLASKEGLEVSVKGQYVFVTQSAAKLQVVKFGVIVIYRKD